MALNAVDIPANLPFFPLDRKGMKSIRKIGPLEFPGYSEGLATGITEIGSVVGHVNFVRFVPQNLEHIDLRWPRQRIREQPEGGP